MLSQSPEPFCIRRFRLTEENNSASSGTVTQTAAPTESQSSSPALPLAGDVAANSASHGAPSATLLQTLKTLRQLQVPANGKTTGLFSLLLLLFLFVSTVITSLKPVPEPIAAPPGSVMDGPAFKRKAVERTVRGDLVTITTPDDDADLIVTSPSMSYSRVMKLRRAWDAQAFQESQVPQHQSAPSSQGNSRDQPSSSSQVSATLFFPICSILPTDFTPQSLSQRRKRQGQGQRQQFFPSQSPGTSTESSPPAYTERTTWCNVRTITRPPVLGPQSEIIPKPPGMNLRSHFVIAISLHPAALPCLGMIHCPTFMHAIVSKEFPLVALAPAKTPAKIPNFCPTGKSQNFPPRPPHQPKSQQKSPFFAPREIPKISPLWPLHQPKSQQKSPIFAPREIPKISPL